MEKMLRRGSGYAVWMIGAALVVLPVVGRAAAFAGGVPGQSLNFTVTENAEPVDTGAPDTTPEAPQDFVFQVAPGTAVESGSLVLCEEGTTCSGIDSSHTNWSDVVIWLGGNCTAAGVCTGTLYSDPPVNGWPDANVGLGAQTMTETLDASGNNGVVYQADDGSGFITTWTIVSDPVPEPGTSLLMAGGLVGIAASSRRLRRLRERMV